MAQATSDPMSLALLQYGGLGVLALCAISAVRVLFKQQTATNEREQRRADGAEQELRALNKDVREQVMPALTRSTEAVSEAMRIMQTLKDRA